MSLPRWEYRVETAAGAFVTALSVVLGSYNRRDLLVSALDSVRKTATGIDVTFIVVDGGSTDGSREYLAAQSDVVLIGQRGPLTGAVKAFNLGFAYALDAGAEWIAHFNDDSEALTDGMWADAIAMLEADPAAGAVAFAFDTWGPFRYDHCAPDRPYVNYGVWRRACVEAVARAQGDPTGRALWNPLYKTYAADTEAGAWAWKLGWKVLKSAAQVHDAKPQDALREGNHGGQNAAGRPDSNLYRQRWTAKEQADIVRPPPEWRRGMKLHIGCGLKRLPAAAGWINCDGLRTPAADVVLDLYDLKGIPSGLAASIYWSHGPEHIYPDKLDGVLRELRRILRPGGYLRVATIDVLGIVENRLLSAKNGSAWNSALYGEADSKDHPFLSHRQAFTAASLKAALEHAGFAGVAPWTTAQDAEIHALNDYARSCALVTVACEGSAP